MSFKAAIAVLCAALAGCGDGGEQLAASVQSGLRQYGFNDVDASRLSPGQLAQLQGILYGSHTSSEKKVLARSAIGGRNSLRGLFAN